MLALGKYATGEALECLNPANIVTGTLGTDVVSCLTDQIANICTNVLPGSWLDIVDTNVGDLPGQIAQCTADLGPFATDKVPACLDPSADPQSIVSCLSAELLGVA